MSQAATGPATVWAARRPAPTDLLVTAAPRLEPNLAGPAVVKDEATGLPVLVVARYPADLAGLRQAMRAFPCAGGMVRSAGIRNPGGAFGYLARKPHMRRNGCAPCLAATTAPAEHNVICGAAAHLAAQLHELVPARADNDQRLADRLIRREWMVADEAWWTSGVVNWMSPLPYHYDQNNAQTWSAMPVVRRGVQGGHLHIPEYDLVLECRDGDVVYFAGWDMIHGVTPLNKTDRDGYRISAVFYTIQSMARCLTPDEEFRRGRAERSAREDGLIARQRRSGLLK